MEAGPVCLQLQLPWGGRTEIINNIFIYFRNKYSAYLEDEDEELELKIIKKISQLYYAT